MGYASTNLTRELCAALTEAMKPFRPHGSLPFGMWNAYGLSVAVLRPENCDNLNQILEPIGAMALLEQESNVIAGADYALDIQLPLGMSKFEIFRLRASLDPHCILWAEMSMTDDIITLTPTLTADEEPPTNVRFNRERIMRVWGVEDVTQHTDVLSFTVDKARIASSITVSVARVASLHLNPDTYREVVDQNREFWHGSRVD